MRRDFIPAHHALLQGKVDGGVLIRRERHARMGISLVAYCSNAQVIITRGQVLDPVAAIFCREDVHGNSRFRVLRQYKRTFEGRAVRALHNTGNGGAIAKSGRRQNGDGDGCDSSGKFHWDPLTLVGNAGPSKLFPNVAKSKQAFTAALLWRCPYKMAISCILMAVQYG